MFQLQSSLLPGLTIYRAVAENETVQAWQDLISALTKAQPGQILQAYHRFQALAITRQWPNLLVDLILNDDNIFSRTIATVGAKRISPALKEMASRDLQILDEISKISAQNIKTRLESVFRDAGPAWPAPSDHPLHPANWPEWGAAPVVPGSTGSDKQVNLSTAQSEAASWLWDTRQEIKTHFATRPWADCIDRLSLFYEQVGTGTFGRFAAAKWQAQAGDGNFAGIANPDPIRLDQLIGLENEKQIILENTDYFVAGLPANNMIFYGHRGTGKSSMVKALLNAYVQRGLRLVEIAKHDLPDFPAVCNLLAKEPAKFILFIDDLSFEENEPEYKALKTMLEGGIAARPANVLIYATSNRRHLVKETYGERQADIHSRDGQEEKLSLADRFGITVTFPSPDQAAYLEIVEALAGQSGLLIKGQELRQLALRWEMWHNGRSGRTARQFIDYQFAQQASKDVPS